MYISFSEIPGNHNLFLDYLYEFENVKKFYKTDFRNKEEYLKIFKKVSDSHVEFRDQLSSILNDQYRNFNPSAKTQKNISALKDKKTLAVVTGQQLGIIGGPLYTFYKIMSAIRLSSFLSERYDDYQFVPVFWLEGDDHDFNEVRELHLINDNNEVIKAAYGEEVLDDENKGSVGNLVLNETINNFYSELEKNLRVTEFTPSLLEKIKSFYTTGKTFMQAFKELIFWMFDEYGLIIFDPQDKRLKEHLKPIFKKELTDFRQHTEKLVNVSAQLEEVYHAQVKVRPVNLFYSNEEGRFLIEPVENEFRLRRKRKKFTYEELIDLIEKEPQCFSPNVLLRPICQDYILPTAFYVGGPSEVSYFAQVTPLYDFYKIEAPIIYPRSSATIIEKNISSIIEKYDIDLSELFLDPEKLKQKVIDSISKVSVEETFSTASNQIEIAFDQLKEKLFEFDKTISDTSSKYKQKIFHHLDELKDKAAEAQKRKHEITLRQIDKISSAVFPNSNLQEREINFIYFANKYSIDIFKKIFDELTINKFEHQIINL
jgi:bacillithiol biosynthesis cysteine-adding enzyme BshC